ncbi:LytR C-terminal domain-containing protein [Aurantimicrobium sp. MWH-Uga1]|uniref:LytR C-terminal domain-containing protein n=1 Tax=Aurantimicrobium sp. MWH-Uga1 TaxID=2079575 RepID=UPI000DED6D61|nr:LytR C-terminal domain-containing protein [Aurantimicrobium sp. MWH-Uga1]AXE54004.1 hypothetical protein AURUGA1_00294 [Aurantimicrobium sp. MWH-Uga1]
MAEKNVQDIFDDLVITSDRRGVHRAPKRPGAGWIKFAWAALATGVLVVGGVGTLIVSSDSISMKDFESIFALPTPAASATPKPTAAPTIDPASVVNVLNATGQAGYATQVGDMLAAEGWTIGAKSNASENTTETFIYYGNPSLEGAARGVAQSLGYGTIKLTDKYIESSAAITLVLGSDYVG